MLRDDRSLAGNNRFEGFIKDLLDEIAEQTGFKRVLPPLPLYLFLLIIRRT